MTLASAVGTFWWLPTTAETLPSAQWNSVDFSAVVAAW